MQISISKLYIVVTGIVVIGIIGFSGNFLFGVFFKGPKPDPSPVISIDNIGGLNPKLQQAAAAIVDPSQKISLNLKKDLQFIDANSSTSISRLYKSFTELPEYVATSTVRGRDDPFTPYVAP